VTRTSLWRFLAIGLPALGSLIAPLPAVDLAFQLRAGSDILRSGAIPTTDPWTFTVAGAPWLDQQWGAQVLLQLVFDATGWTGLVVLRAALVALAFGLLLLVVRRRAPVLPAAAASLLVLAAFVVAAPALALRPQLFAIDLFAATLLILAARADHPRLVWLIPVIAVAWANLHGTFLFAPALCGLAWLADLFDAARSGRGPAPAPDRVSAPGRVSPPEGAAGPGRGSWAGRAGWRSHTMLAVGLASVVATLVNPFGLGAWGYVANLTSDPTIASRVSEWQPPSPLTATGAVVWLSILAVVVLAAVRLRRGQAAAAAAQPRGSMGWIPWPAILTLLLFGGFALLSGRGQAWWPFVAVFVVAPWLAQPQPDGDPTPASLPAPASSPRPTPPMLRRLNLAIAVALVLVGAAFLPLWRSSGPAGVPVSALTFAPQGIAAELRQLTAPVARFCDDRVWNPQPWGSWLELAAPCARYAVDSRIELYPASVWDAVDVISGAADGWDQALARLGVTIVVTDRSTERGLEGALLASHTWTRVYADCDGSVWKVASGDAVGIAVPPTDCP